MDFVWVAFIICTNQFASPKSGHESLKYSTGLPFQTFRLFQIFFTGKTRKVVLHLLSKHNSRKYFPNGHKAPKYLFWLREAWQSTTSPESHCLLDSLNLSRHPPLPCPLGMIYNSPRWPKTPWNEINIIISSKFLSRAYLIRSGGSRRGAQGVRPPLYFYQTETKKKILGRRPPPFPLPQLPLLLFQGGWPDPSLIWKSASATERDEMLSLVRLSFESNKTLDFFVCCLACSLFFWCFCCCEWKGH